MNGEFLAESSSNSDHPAVLPRYLIRGEFLTFETVGDMANQLAGYGAIWGHLKNEKRCCNQNVGNRKHDPSFSSNKLFPVP